MTAPIWHPRWCRQEHCTDIAHRGRVITINPADADHAPVAVQLVQPRTPGVLPSIVVAGETGALVLSLRQIKAVQYVTRTMLRSAERGERVAVSLDHPDRRR
jgi:hypothetical protein